MSAPHDDRPAPNIRWSWSRALPAAAYSLPAVVVTAADPSIGIPLAVGVLPATMLPIPGPRRARVVILAVGSMTGLSLFAGGALAHLPVLATALSLALVVIAGAALAARLPAGQLVLTLCVPLVAAGLSYDDWASSVQTALLLIGGAVYAWLVSLLWPDRPAAPRPPRTLPDPRTMLDYGARLGAAAALGYLCAVALSLDHPGWAPAACLLVARPQADLLRLRGIGRIVSVTVGALAAGWVLHADLAPVAMSGIVAVGLTGAGGTGGSRWYVTPAFSTFFVFLMLVGENPASGPYDFNQRVGETLLGVGLAVVFGVLLPMAPWGKRQRTPVSPRSDEPRT